MQTSTGSAYRRWLAATIKGPLEGTFSAPTTVNPKSNRPKVTITRRNNRYRADMSFEGPRRLLSAFIYRVLPASLGTRRRLGLREPARRRVRRRFRERDR